MMRVRSTLVRSVVVVLLATSFAAPAHAALTTAEKAEAVKLANAYGALLSGETCLGQLLDDHTDDDTTVTSLRTVAGHFNTLLGHLLDATNNLLGANPYAIGSGSYTTFEAQSRATQVAATVTAVASAATTNTTLATAAAAAKANVDASGDTLLDCVTTAAESAVTTYMQGVDLVGQTYANARTGYNGTGRIVGPHGTHTSTMNQFARARGLLKDAVVSMVEMYDTVTLGEARWTGSASGEPLDNFRTILTNAFERVGLNLTLAMFNAALIPTSITECGYTDFHLVGRRLESLLSEHSESSSQRNQSGNPYAYAVLWAEWQTGFRTGLTTRPNAHAKWDAFTNNWLLSWTRSDHAAWDGWIEFPAGVTRPELIAQASLINTGNTTPLCNATTSPAGTMLYPADAQTVAGRITVQWTCRDNVTAIKARAVVAGVEVATDLVAANNGISAYFPTGSTASSTTVTVGNNLLGFVVGDTITGTDIPANTTITALNANKTEMTISNAATGTNSGLTFTVTHPVTYSYRWDTTGVANGAVTLKGRCYDNAENSADTAQISVTVAN